MTFAGFWVDGAVRRPEQRHGGELKVVVAKSKDGSDIGSYLTASLSVPWDSVYWLDTTPRESLTPEELFSVLKIMWTELEYIKLHAGNSWVFGEGAIIETPITWGNIRQYPSPIEPQWIRITRENVGQYLFRDCRFRDRDIDKWHYGKVAGWCETESRALVNSDFNDEMFVMNWNIVEVQS